MGRSRKSKIITWVKVIPNIALALKMEKKVLQTSLLIFSSAIRSVRSIVRAFEDGNFVFLHVHQNLNDGQAQWVTTDIFRADEAGKLVEHWDNKEVMPDKQELTNLGKF